MLWRIAGGKLREERAVLATLTGLMLLSVLLACAGAGLITRLAGSADSLLERANAPDLVQMHSGTVDVGAIDDFAVGRPDVAAHQVTSLLGIDGAQLFFDGESQASNVQQNSLVVPGDERDLLLDELDRPVTDVDHGTIWLPVIYEDQNGMAVGSTVTVTAPDGYRLELEVAGFLRDSTMNPAIAGSKRLAVGSEDLAAVAEHTGTWEQLISFWVQDRTADITTVRSAYEEAGLPAAGPMVDRSAFVLFTVFVEGLVASMVLLGAAMVLMIGMLCLRLALRAALERDRREIAVMTAIGISARDVRSLYLLVYGGLAVVAGAAGLLGGIALERVLSSGLTRYLGEVGGASVVVVPALVALALVLGVLASVALMLRRLRRLGPIDVLRGAGPSTGAERPGRLSLHRSPLPVGPSLGLLSLLRRGGSAPLLVTVFAVCTALVMVPTAVATTLTSPQFSTYLGLGAADLRIDLPHTEGGSAAQFDLAEQALAEDPRIVENTALVTTRHRVKAGDGTELNLPVSSGDHTAMPVAYADGRAPRSQEEIALSLLALAEAGVAVGDELPMQVQGQWRELRIVGSYQDLTHGGITAQGLLPTAGEQVIWYVLGASVTPGTEASAVVGDLAGQLPGARVSETEEYRAQLLGPLGERVTATAALAASAAVALAVLLAVMICRLWLATDAVALSVQRALGASPLTLRAPYLTRMLLTLALGVVVGAALSLTVGQGLFNLLLEGMFGGLEHLFQGTSRIDLVIDPITTVVALPLLLAAVTTVATLWSCRHLRTADVRTLTSE